MIVATLYIWLCNNGNIVEKRYDSYAQLQTDLLLIQKREGWLNICSGEKFDEFVAAEHITYYRTEIH